MDTLVECSKFKVCRKEVRTESGLFPYEVVIHPGSVVILPFVEEERIAMIRHNRPAVGREIWELPAGSLDVPGEGSKDAALRELEEETGYRADSITYACSFYSSPGFLDEIIHAYIASDLVKTKQRLQPGEELTVEILDFEKAMEMVQNGEIVDAKTMVVLLRWQTSESLRVHHHKDRKRVP